ncbi:hydroxyethylthiazole kinase [Metaclostridioides mangenotii]|uniref:hydroxyethylthiazole kinase n=1 Tax=Metaclostridioides mangenotii TaxID=1540 RepID=UPI0026F05B38|nr:hydroxyethylthiazole kinase [Clostridioides mangenotii]
MKDLFSLADRVRQSKPLVVQYTNRVTINDCANVTLAIGASPIMSASIDEVDDMVSSASSLVINIGDMESGELYIKAGKAANKFNIPVVLDPVGAFASQKRRELIEVLLKEVDFTVIKGNISEMKFLAGYEFNGRGVDCFDEDDPTEVAMLLAKRYKCIAAATGKIDAISDGKNTYKIFNGDENLQRVTGTGCMCTSLVGSFLGATENRLNAAAMGILSMSLSGELAGINNPCIGTFRVNLMDNLSSLSIEKFEAFAKIEKI